MWASRNTCPEFSLHFVVVACGREPRRLPGGRAGWPSGLRFVATFTAGTREPMSTKRTQLTVALLGVLALVLVNGGRADATTTPTSTTTAPVQAAAGWLATQFEDSTHLPAPTGDHFDNSFGGSFYPNYGENADVIFGLAAAAAGKDKITTALNYLATNLDAYADVSATAGGPYDGSLAKVALAVEVAGADTTSFGGTNLISKLRSDECTAATAPYDSFGDTVCVAPGAASNIFSGISEALVILAEVRSGTTITPAIPLSAITPAAASYFLSLQCSNGGFTSGISACGAGAADLDATSYAIMALAALGGHPTQLANAVSWLHAQQNAAGYWVSQSVPNVNSTGLAVAALASQSVDVSSARSWLLSQQVAAGAPGAGALMYAGAFDPTTADGTSSSVLATAQGLTGLVENGSLAVLSASGATPGTSAFAPTQTVSAASADQGSTQSVTADGFAAGEQVEAVLHSTPVTVGTAVASASGTVTISFVVPASVAAGAHTLTLTGATSGLSVSSALAVTVAPVAATTTPATTTPATTTADTTSDPLGNTGLNGPVTAELAALGVLSVLGGSGFLLAARRRRA
jgi:hypothetical protein